MSKRVKVPDVRPFPVRTPHAQGVRVPKRPGWLDGAAAEMWNSLAPLMAANGWLDEITAAGFATLCELHADVRQLEDLVDDLGLQRAVETKVFDALLETQRQLLEYYRAFFMTPLSRAEHGVSFKPGA